MACRCGVLIFAGQGIFLSCLGLHACAWAGRAFLFTSGGSDLQVCRCTPGLWPITPLQLKVLLQAGVADLFPVGGSGLRCVADFLAGGLVGWGCLGFACCCSQVMGAGRHTWQLCRPLPYSVIASF